MISVIVPVYNVEKYLEECLDSIKNQTFNDIEVILVNDGSIDGSKEICERFCLQDSRFKLINQENQGQSVARNRGFKESRGQYIMFVDSDDVVKEDLVEVLFSYMKADVDIVECKLTQNIEELNLIIEKMNTFYFTGLSYFLGDDFNFTTRVKMPPKDPFNSMLSFGYSLLIYEIQNLILSKGLNPYIGFFASDEEGIPCLCSDLMEEWRTILVDALAFKLLKTKKITINDFETNEETGTVLLKEEARILFLTEFGKLLKEETGNIIGTCHKISYRRAIEYQIHLLIEALEGNSPEKYKPFEIEK